jgi:hypothetical protein
VRDIAMGWALILGIAGYATLERVREVVAE